MHYPRKFLVTYRCAHLQVVFAHRLPVIHSIESRNLVHTHRRHLQQSCNLIHDAQTRESVLSLSKIQQWHHSGFFVLWGIALQDLVDELVILLGELEGDVGIIVGSVTMLNHVVRH
jgi:hypothetical protein